jgi:uncharacterized membrane protein
MTLELVVLVSVQAGEARRALQALKRHIEPAARNAVVLMRDEYGLIFVFETGDVVPGHGALLEETVGLLVPLLDGLDPAHVAVQAASMVSIGLAEDRVSPLPAGLQPGGSALVVLVEREWVEGLLDLLATFQGQVWQQALADMYASSLSQEARWKETEDESRSQIRVDFGRLFHPADRLRAARSARREGDG